MNKLERRLRRKKGIRKKVHGTKYKPRITVFKSLKHIYVQVIDDEVGNTLCSSSDFEVKGKNNREGALLVGRALGDKLMNLKIKEAVFDRNGYLYHGIVRVIAEGVRQGGIKV